MYLMITPKTQSNIAHGRALVYYLEKPRCLFHLSYSLVCHVGKQGCIEAYLETQGIDAGARNTGLVVILCLTIRSPDTVWPSST